MIVGSQAEADEIDALIKVKKGQEDAALEAMVRNDKITMGTAAQIRSSGPTEASCSVLSQSQAERTAADKTLRMINAALVTLGEITPMQAQAKTEPLNAMAAVVTGIAAPATAACATQFPSAAPKMTP